MRAERIGKAHGSGLPRRLTDRQAWSTSDQVVQLVSEPGHPLIDLGFGPPQPPGRVFPDDAGRAADDRAFDVERRLPHAGSGTPYVTGGGRTQREEAAAAPRRHLALKIEPERRSRGLADAPLHVRIVVQIFEAVERQTRGRDTGKTVEIRELGPGLFHRDAE